MSRIFSRTQKNEIFNKANGKCEKCFNDLSSDWEAHHKIPYSQGGLTEIVNGMAVCISCHKILGQSKNELGNKNLEQETKEMNGKSFKLRQAQSEMLQITLEKLRKGEDVLTAILSCGTGKTLGAILVAKLLHQQKIIDGVVFLTPRGTLCDQYADAWSEKRDEDDFSKFFNDSPGSIDSVKNKLPVLAGSDVFGYSVTYNALNEDRKKNKSEQVHFGKLGILSRKFLLVVDEAQSLGDKKNYYNFDEQSMAKKWTQTVQKLASHPNCKFKLVMTATEIRSDGRPLAFAKYHHKAESEDFRLIYDLKWTYAKGVNSKPPYLRWIDFTLLSYDFNWENAGHKNTGEADKDYTYIMRQPKVWQDLADVTVAKLEDVRKKTNCDDYKGMISAIDKEHAIEISTYLLRKKIKCLTVISNPENPDENLTSILKKFDQGNYDILINVRKAYIGYDNPKITVVGVLTGWSFHSFLEQLIGRGGRIWKDRFIAEQELYVILPNNPKTRGFVRSMRTATSKYIRMIEGIKKDEGDLKLYEVDGELEWGEPEDYNKILNSEDDEIEETIEQVRDLFEGEGLHEGWEDENFDSEDLEELDRLLAIRKLDSIGMGLSEESDLSEDKHEKMLIFLAMENIPMSPSKFTHFFSKAGGNPDVLIEGIEIKDKSKKVYSIGDIEDLNREIDKWVRKIAGRRCLLKYDNYHYNTHINQWKKEKMKKDWELWHPGGKANFWRRFDTKANLGEALESILMQLVAEHSQLLKKHRKSFIGMNLF